MRGYRSRSRARQGAWGHAESTGHAVELSPPLDNGARKTETVAAPPRSRPGLLRRLWAWLFGGAT